MFAGAGQDSQPSPSQSGRRSTRSRAGQLIVQLLCCRFVLFSFQLRDDEHYCARAGADSASVGAQPQPSNAPTQQGEYLIAVFKAEIPCTHAHLWLRYPAPQHNVCTNLFVPPVDLPAIPEDNAMEVDGAARQATASQATAAAPAPSVNRSHLPGGATPVTGRTGGGAHSRGTFSRGTFGTLRSPPSHRPPMRADLGGTGRRPLVARAPAISGDVAPVSSRHVVLP